MSDLDGPDPVRELMMQAELDADSEYKERVILLEEQMALASVIIISIMLPTKCCKEHMKKHAAAITHDSTHFVKKATEYIAKFPNAAKNS